MKTVLVLLIGNRQLGDIDEYQLLQEKAALGDGNRLGINVEVVFAPGFDHLEVLRRRLAEKGSRPLDAVITEPPSVAILEIILRGLRGETGLVLLNAWSPSVEENAGAWGAFPFGTISTDHTQIGEIQGRQISQILPAPGNVLCVTGPQGSSAAQQRLAGTKSTVRPNIRLLETEGQQWTETDGISAFNGWYGSFKMRSDVVSLVAGQSDELAIGAQNAAKALKNRAHRDMFSKARFVGVDACPNYGKRLVDSGVLTASILTPPNTGLAVEGLANFWRKGKPLPLRAYTEATPYPPTSLRTA